VPSDTTENPGPSGLARFFLQWVATTVSVLVAAHLVPGVGYDRFQSLAVAALILGLLNAFVRPILVFVTFPLTIITFGLFLLVVNAATIGIVASFLGGFVVDGLWAGIGAAVVTGLVSWVAGSIIPDDRRAERK
jgi:putative membrane protein